MTEVLPHRDEFFASQGDRTDLSGPPIPIELPITLGQFLKVAGLVMTGGEGKQFVAAGLVRVNGEVETRRGRKLLPGDVVEYQGHRAVVGLREDIQG